MKYKIVLENSPGEGIAASVPYLPGCHSQGVDETEALQNIREAIGDYLIVANELTKHKTVREIEILEEMFA